MLLAAFASLVIKEPEILMEVSKPESDQEEDNESLPLNLIPEEDAIEAEIQGPRRHTHVRSGQGWD